jgi:hypothetical protein
MRNRSSAQNWQSRHHDNALSTTIPDQKPLQPFSPNNTRVHSLPCCMFDMKPKDKHVQRVFLTVLYLNSVKSNRATLNYGYYQTKLEVLD